MILAVELFLFCQYFGVLSIQVFDLWQLLYFLLIESFLRRLMKQDFLSVLLQKLFAVTNLAVLLIS